MTWGMKLDEENSIVRKVSITGMRGENSQGHLKGLERREKEADGQG